MLVNIGAMEVAKVVIQHPDPCQGGIGSAEFACPGADVEIMVYLGILDTRKYFGSQKILTEIIAILWREWFCEINNGSLLLK